MRTIEFRGKDEDGKWLYGDLRQRLGHWPAIIESYCTDEGKVGYREVAVDKNTVGQLTVYYDKNGKKIYEGDILRSDAYPFSDGMDKDNYLGVVFCTADGSFEVMQLVTKQSKVRGIYNFINRSFYDINMEKVEVIGNIFDNKGLFRDSDEKIMEWYNS